MSSLVFGLPLHPLVVHAVVVLLPLGALAAIAAIISPPVRERYGTLIMGLVTVAVAATAVAKFSGEILAETERLPQRHSDLGHALLTVAVVLLLSVWAWWLLLRRRERIGFTQSNIAEKVTSGSTILLSLAAVVLTVLTGHTGAQATWGDSVAAGATTAVPAPGPATEKARTPTPALIPTPTSTPTPTERGYTVAQVKQNGSASSCWASVNGSVYDLTSWIARHPGGRQRILNLCGTDATSQFTNQHDGDAKPNAQLAEFRIGRLL